ncbi:MAG: cobaltochelatase subunit CobN [Candidatus Syntropharchaeales archaeon]
MINDTKNVRSFAPLLVAVLFMALLIVPLSVTAQPEGNRILFVLGTDENRDSLYNASASTTLEVEICNASVAMSKDFSNETVVFLASLDNETVSSINQTINRSAHVFAYNLSSNISIGNVPDANITRYWVGGGDVGMLHLITYLGAKFYDLQAVDVLFILQDDTIHRYYLKEAMKDYALPNTTISLTIYNRDQAAENNLTSFDIIALYHLSYLPAVQTKLDEANSTSKTIWLSQSTSLWDVNVPQSIGKDAYKKYWIPSGIENHRRILTYLAVTLIDADEEIQPGLKLPRNGILHPDYKSEFQPCKDCLFQNLSSYMEWYNETGKYHSENPTVGLTLSGYYYANGYYLDDWIAIIREFENRSVNVIPILDGTDLREVFFDEAENKTTVDIVLSYMGTFHGSKAFNLSSINERKEVIARLGVPWMNCITTGQTPPEWVNSTIGIPTSYIGWAVALQELEGLIEPIVIGGSVLDEITNAKMKVAIAGRASYVVNRTLMWTDLKYLNNSEKRIALIYYSYPPGKAEIGASYMDVPRTLEVLLNEMDGAGYDLGGNFTKYNISDRNDTMSNNGSIVAKLITQGRNIGAWAQDDVDELARSGAIVLVPENDYIQWFNEFPEDMRDAVIKDWDEPPGDQMVYTAPNGSRYLVIPCIRYGNILLAPQPYRGYQNSEKLLYHNSSLPPNHQYIAFYLWLKQGFDASALVHIGTHGTLEWLPGKQVGLDSRSWPEALIQDFPNPYIYIVDNVGEGTQAKRRSYSVIVDHATPPFIPAGLYGNYSNLHQAIHHYLLAKENGNAPLMSGYKNTSIRIIKDTHIDEDLGINISCDASFDEFEALVIYGKVHDYLHEMMYANMPHGLRIFANPIPDESAVALVRGMLGDEYIQDIHAVNASCDSHDVEEYNKTESYRLLYRVLVDGVNITDAQNEILGNSSADVSADLEIAEEYYQNIIASSPNEIKNLLDALDAKYIMPAVGGDVLRTPDVLPTGRNFYSFDPRTIPTEEAYAIGKQTIDALLVDYYERNGEFPEKVAFVLWGIETMRNHGIPHTQMLYLMGVEPMWKADGKILYYSKPKAENLKIIDISNLTIQLANGTVITRPRIDVIGHSSGLHRDQFPWQMDLLDDAVRIVSQLNESEDMNYVRKHSLALKAYYMELMESMNVTVDEEEAEKLSMSRLFGPPEGDYGVRIADAAWASDTWENTDRIADQFIERSGNVYIDGEMYTSLLISGVDVFKAAIKDTDISVFIRSSNLYGVLDGDDPFQYFGGLSLAIARVSDGERPEMWITNARNIGNPRMQTLSEFMNMEMRTRMLNPNYIKGMMEHGYAGAGKLSDHLANLFGWDVVDTRFVDAADWNEVYEVYILDKYDLDTKGWFDENSPWARQEMMARMLEASRKDFWSPTDEIKTALAEEYQQSVEKYGPCCCIVCCGNPMIDAYVKGLLQPGAKAKHHSSSSDGTYPPEPSEGTANQTTSLESSTGVGITGEVMVEPPSETSKSSETSDAADKVEGKVMTEMKTSSSLPISGAPLIAIVAVIAIMALVGAGLWLKRR